MTKLSSTLHISRVQMKNFFSVGNSPLTLDLDTYAKTMVIGKNGSGKSSVTLDAIMYALFGKPYREIKLGQLINTINNKDMLVEIWFKSHGVEYYVKRGQKPAVFEIYQEDQMITMDAATKDYQKVLESQILKLNGKTFRQIIAIGSATYVPFMQLKAAERRQIIEEILDISVFSKMSDIARSKEREAKADLSRVEAEIKVRNDILKSHQANLTIANDDKKLKEETQDAKVLEINLSLESQTARLKELCEKSVTLKESTSEYDSLIIAVNKLQSSISKNKGFIESINSQISSVLEKTHCPTCQQEIPEETRQTSVDSLQSNLIGIQKKVSESEAIYLKIKEKTSAMEGFVSELNTISSDCRVIASDIKSLRSRLEDLTKEVDFNKIIVSLSNSISATLNEIQDLSEKVTEYNETYQYYHLVSSMLKDSGIKSTIVSNYLPVINTLANQYLEDFGLFVGFELSSTFEETIRSRHRDTFSYNSFSEGEKQKIDLSLLFVWRHISSMKSTISCNLLFLDEVGGGNMDEESHDGMIDAIGKVAENIFLITHRPSDEEQFDRVWEFSRPKNFTELTERFS